VSEQIPVSEPSPSEPPDQTAAPGWELFQRIRESEGDKIFWELEGLRASYFVFDQNFHTLRVIIENLENPENRPKLVGIDKREQLKTFQMENMRHLHNFLAGANMLIDHTRVLTNKLYEGKPFHDEYKGKVAEIVASASPAALVKGLRNWMLHRGLLPLSFVFGLWTNQTTSVVLSVKDLKAWDGWTADAKAFLAGCDSDPRLIDIAKAYHDQVQCLYTWLGERMAQVHAAAFEELNEMKRQYRQLMFPGQ
jgi:hypothetical protein